MTTTAARLTAARLAVRNAARGIDAGNLSAPLTATDQRLLAPLALAVAACLDAEEAVHRGEAVARTSLAVETARTLVRKSKLARMLCGRGDLWNGADRAHQFALMNAAADVRRLTARSLGV